MMRPTTEQLQRLTDLINERLGEFGDNDGPVFEPLTLGKVRLFATVFEEWYSEEHFRARVFEAEIVRPDVSVGSNALPQLFGTDAKGVNGDHLSAASPARGGQRARSSRTLVRQLPSQEDVIAFVRRLAHGGVMPSLKQFDLARPGGWSTAQAHLLRFRMSWRELAQAAGLEVAASGPQRVPGKTAVAPGSTPSPENNAIGDFH